MACLTWLHISDWHQGEKDFDRQNIRDALIKDIKRRASISPSLDRIDFIVFSGDVAFSGKSNEYEAAKKELLDPLLVACEAGPNQLFIVPGNHDMDCTRSKLHLDGLLETQKSEAEIGILLNDERKRERLLEKFWAFSSFVSKYTGQNKPDYANIRRWEIGENKIALLGLNSALICKQKKDANRDINEKGNLWVGEPQISEPLEKISDVNVAIVVLHHPFDWLFESDRDSVEKRLMKRCDFILHGHQHETKLKVINSTYGSCVIIPAGSCYERISKNKNCSIKYNLVHMDLDAGKCNIFLRRWSDQKNEWVEDIDSYPGGKVEFTHPKVLPVLQTHEIEPEPGALSTAFDQEKQANSN